ncbi:hypothetical protein SNE40_016346 [Patella caerulea]|uniref:Uncharacterized protein n=1 Tax=Patella caerulea TaxID=87958 RepID=A0AAN8J9S6_PATCE
MPVISVLVIAIATILNQEVQGQGFPFQMGARNGMGMFGASMWGSNPAQSTSYMTCIGSTATDDEMRITFSDANQNPWSNWGMAQQDELEMEAKISAGMSSPIQGHFQLVITENGHIEGFCDAQLLGNIINTNVNQPMGVALWFNVGQSRPSGVIGRAFSLSPGQTVSMIESVSNIDMDRLAGSGIAMCPSNQVIGTQCINPIPLCCTLTKDSKPAEALPNNMMQGTPMGGGFGSGQMGGMSQMGPMGPMGPMGGMPPMGAAGSMGPMGSAGPMSPMGGRPGMGSMNGMAGNNQGMQSVMGGHVGGPAGPMVAQQQQQQQMGSNTGNMIFPGVKK